MLHRFVIFLYKRDGTRRGVKINDGQGRLTVPLPTFHCAVSNFNDVLALIRCNSSFLVERKGFFFLLDQ